MEALKKALKKALKYSCIGASIALLLSAVIFAIGIFADSVDLKAWANGISLVCLVVFYVDIYVLLILILIDDDPNRPKH